LWKSNVEKIFFFKNKLMVYVTRLARELTESCVLKYTEQKKEPVKEEKEEGDLDESWVEIQVDDENMVLKYCWENLPLSISFEEFKTEMLKLKQEKSQKPTLTYLGWCTQYTVWFFHSLWVLSGYASTLFTVAKYKDIIFQLLYWFLFQT
jgi:hypothetical protein